MVNAANFGNDIRHDHLYTYDKNGNQTSIEDPASDITTWTYENQLAEIEGPSGDLVTYTYAPVNKKSDEFRLSKETDQGGI